MPDLIETSYGTLKIFSQNNGCYVVQQDSLLEALRLDGSDDIILAFFDLCDDFDAKRKLGAVTFLDVKKIVENILPTFSDFCDGYDEILEATREVLKVLRKCLASCDKPTEINLKSVLSALKPAEVEKMPKKTTPEEKPTPELDEVLKEIFILTNVPPKVIVKAIAAYKVEQCKAEMTAFVERYGGD